MEEVNDIKLYEKLYRIRRAEQRIVEIYPTDKIKSPCHLSIGQEFISVAVCHNLRKTDVVFGTYRGHALYIAKGGDLKKFFAELYGKETGCCSGRGGSMHLIDKEAGLMGTSAIVASTIPEAVGYAYSMKLQNKDVLTVVFFGDGATDEGSFYESINFAALKKLPVIFVCENNGKAVYSRIENRYSRNFIGKTLPWDIEFRKYEYKDISIFSKLTNNVMENIEHIRNGYGPMFIEFTCERLMEHVGVGVDEDYKDTERLKHFNTFDVVRNTKRMIPPVITDDIEGRVDIEIEEAIRFAEKSPFPKEEDLYRNVW